MANEVRLIDANALQNILLPIAISLEREYGSLGGAISGVMHHVDVAPTIDPESLRPNGRWTAIGADCRGYANAFECSNCETVSHTYTYMKECEFEYCPVCGAKMEG